MKTINKINKKFDETKIIQSNFKAIWDKNVDEKYRKDHCAYCFEGLDIEIKQFYTKEIKELIETITNKAYDMAVADVKLGCSRFHNAESTYVYLRALRDVTKQIVEHLDETNYI